MRMANIHTQTVQLIFKYFNCFSQIRLLFWPCSVILAKKKGETKEKKLYDAPLIYNPFPRCRAKLAGASLFRAPAKMLLQAHRSYLTYLDKLHTTAAERCSLVVSEGRLPAEVNWQHRPHEPFCGKLQTLAFSITLGHLHYGLFF